MVPDAMRWCAAAARRASGSCRGVRNVRADGLSPVRRSTIGGARVGAAEPLRLLGERA
jgi:hypothetical protein